VVTAETLFYAQGGGQPSDTGIMHSASQGQDPDSTGNEKTSSFSVQAVRHSVSSPGVILHLGRFEPDAYQTFTVGQTINQSIDGEKRHLNSRIHTGGHIVGLAVRHLSRGSGEHSAVPDLAQVTELKAQHYPNAAFVEFRGLIDGKQKDAIQAQCDAFVSQALPIKVYWWNETELREKCAIVPENIAVPVVPDGNDGELGLVRAVDIEGAGAYPCGGTHVADTSVVGKVEVRKISRSKGISKVSYQIR
jgi:Ser-tRNA(Ala) deacylase AlaX